MRQKDKTVVQSRPLNGVAVGLVPSLPISDFSEPISEGLLKHAQRSRRRPFSVQPAHLRTPQNLVDSNFWCQSAMDYIACLRRLLTNRWPENVVLGPTRTDVDWLFIYTVQETPFLAMSQWIAQVISTFEVLGVPEKLGLMVLYTRYFKVRYPSTGWGWFC